MKHFFILLSDRFFLLIVKAFLAVLLTGVVYAQDPYDPGATSRNNRNDEWVDTAPPADLTFDRHAFENQTVQRPSPQGAIIDPEVLNSRRAGRPEQVRPLTSLGIPVRVQLKHPLVQRIFQIRDGLPASLRAKTGPDYPMSYLKTLNDEDLVALLTQIAWYQIPDLFEYNPDALAFYQNESRIRYLIKALETRGNQYTVDDSKGIPTLVEVIRAGFYLGFYHEDTLGYLNQRSFHDLCLPAMRTTQSNSAFGLGSAAQDEVVEAMGLLIADGSCDRGIVNAFVTLLKEFNDRFSEWALDYYKAAAVYYVYSGICYDLTYDVLQGGDNVEATPFYKAIDLYLDELFRLANHLPYEPATGWLVDNAVYFAGYDGRFHSRPRAGLKVVTDAMDLYGRDPWVYASAQAAEIIQRKYGSKDYYGNTLDWNLIREEIRNQYAPLRKKFDNGLFVCRAGKKVDDQKIKKLIWAHKETKAQFFRALRSDRVIDPGQHGDDVLTIIIFNSPYEYEMNRFAWGLDTNNGGMYIEECGSFFTYERTPQESIYTLEELFRHEGVHYLQGRYEEPGLFGDSPLYDNDRLTWIDEGSAEFFAGATRIDSVKTRLIKAKIIAGFDPTTWYDVDQVMHAAYADGWDFYHYACAFVDYLYRNQWDNYLDLLDELKANDATGFSAICSQNAGNAAMQAGYNGFLQYLKDNVGSFTDPVTSNDYLSSIPPQSMDQVLADIISVTSLAEVYWTSTTSPDWATYTLRGTYAAGQSTGSEVLDWWIMDVLMNTWLKKLSAFSWSGYKTNTGYFTSYRKDAANNVTWQVVLHGLATDPVVINNKPPVAQMNGPYVGCTKQAIAFSSLGSNDPDGHIISYLWDFGDGMQSIQAHPTHIYVKSGIYTVSLLITDNGGAQSIPMTTTLARITNSEPITTENEPNDKYKQANGPLGDGIGVSASTLNKDYWDWYFFDTTSAGTVTLSYIPQGFNSNVWVVYHESDLEKYIICGSDNGASFTVPADRLGRYYIEVYSIGEGNIYTLTVSGTPIYVAQSAPVICSFTAEPATIMQGESSTLSWSVAGAASLSLDQGIGPVTGQTSKSVNPLVTTTYTLTASNCCGNTRATVIVTVRQPELVADFGNNGLWLYNGKSWTQLTPVNVEYLGVYGDKLVADGGAYGLWEYDGVNWKQIHTWDAENTGNPLVCYRNNLVVDFGNKGLWLYNGKSWTQLTPVNVEYLGVYGDKLVADGGAYGLWEYDGVNWKQIHTWDAENTGNPLVCYRNNLVVDFGNKGLWLYNGKSWTQLTPVNVEYLGVYGDKLVTDGGAYGLWEYDGVNWKRIKAWNADNTGNTLVPYLNALVVDFGSNGLWKYDGQDWRKLHSFNVEYLGIYSDKLVADGGAYGLWEFDGTNWKKISEFDADPSGNPLIGIWSIGAGTMNTEHSQYSE